MESNPYTSPSANLFGSTGSEMEIVPQDVITPLVRTKFWVRFISVMLWISVALMLLSGVVMGIGAVTGMGNDMPTGSASMQAGMFMGMSVMYILLSLFYIFPAIKLWSYGTQIANLAASRSTLDLMKALNTQRSFWKFVGVLTLVSIILGIVAVIGVVAFGAAAAMGSMPTGTEL
ncbi:hypothetical protein EI77_04477 [Prosthecobacter fusiformis]|uniref:Uncharacterized protein n=1 Tax=Prosthecobacter fusiformis TaxID=48464 RepID=A0A4R7RJS5_9BACT|nr:DUF5362 family protein [Prosthecobacter fusiformis]TDU63156.1 hypothetical protein EI77_04477 [Prosthecobacter fusiformis]